jgi:hypothetical protein
MIDEINGPSTKPDIQTWLIVGDDSNSNEKKHEDEFKKLKFNKHEPRNS